LFAEIVLGFKQKIILGVRHEFPSEPGISQAMQRTVEEPVDPKTKPSLTSGERTASRTQGKPSRSRSAG